MWIAATGSTFTGKVWTPEFMPRVIEQMTANIYYARGFALIGGGLIISGICGVEHHKHWWGWATITGVFVWVMFVGAVLPIGVRG